MPRILAIPRLSTADALWRLYVLDTRAGRTRHEPPPKRRAMLAAQVGGGLMQRYAHLKETKDRPVVRLEHGACPACGTHYAPSHPYAALDASGEVRGCQTCGRLLAFLEPAAFAVAE